MSLKRKKYTIFIVVFLIAPMMLLFNGEIKVGGSTDYDVYPVYDLRPEIQDDEYPNLTAKNMSELFGLQPMWDMGYNGTGVSVAVLDTGIDDGHDELSGKIIYTKDFTNDAGITGMDYEGHGTVVAGIVGSKGDGDGTFMGIAPDVSLMNIKVINSTGSGDLQWVSDGIVEATAKGADIISLSLGAQSEGWYFVHEAVENAVENGSVVVSAAGNEGSQFGTISTPGDVVESITVGASTFDSYIISFSSAGPTRSGNICKPDLVAPGVHIIGPASSEGSYSDTFNYGGNDYAIMSGTSMSTPIVSGLCAILKEATDESPEAIKVALMHSATDLGYTQYRQGYGVPNVTKAYELLSDSEYEPVLFLPNKLPIEPIEREDLYGQVITVIAGKKYTGITFKTDLPLKVPNEDELDGHFTFELEADQLSISEARIGTIQILSDEGKVLAEMELEVIPETIFSITSLIIAGIFLIALTSIGSFFLFNYARGRSKRKACECNPSDPDCDCDF